MFLKLCVRLCYIIACPLHYRVPCVYVCWHTHGFVHTHMNRCPYIHTWVCMFSWYAYKQLLHRHSCAHACIYNCIHTYQCDVEHIFMTVYVQLYTCLCSNIIVQLCICADALLWLHLYVDCCILVHRRIQMCVFMYVFINICAYMHIYVDDCCRLLAIHSTHVCNNDIHLPGCSFVGCNHRFSKSPSENSGYRWLAPGRCRASLLQLPRRKSHALNALFWS